MRSLVFWASLSLAGLVSSRSFAATAEFRAARYEVTPAMVTSGAPDGAIINDFFVTTDADILSINRVDITGAELYNLPFPDGTDTVQYMYCAFCFRDENRYYPDSWISTPGNTSVLGSGFPGGGISSWGDISNDGPQYEFMFARLTTLPGHGGLFEGRVSLADSSGPEAFPFSFAIGVPEPTSLVLLMTAVAGVFTSRIRGV